MFGGICHSFCLFFIFYNIHTYIHTITFIQYIYPSPFAEASLHFFIACLLSGGTSLWCRAENRTRACLTASRRATNSATPHHANSATPHHTQPRRTILSHAAPYSATPHHTQPRRTILSHAAPCLSHAAPYSARPHHTQPRRTILSHAAPSIRNYDFYFYIDFV